MIDKIDKNWIPAIKLKSFLIWRPFLTIRNIWIWIPLWVYSMPLKLLLLPFRLLNFQHYITKKWISLVALVERKEDNGHRYLMMTFSRLKFINWIIKKMKSWFQEVFRCGKDTKEVIICLLLSTYNGAVIIYTQLLSLVLSATGSFILIFFFQHNVWCGIFYRASVCSKEPLDTCNIDTWGIKLECVLCNGQWQPRSFFIDILEALRYSFNS